MTGSSVKRTSEHATQPTRFAVSWTACYQKQMELILTPFRAFVRLGNVRVGSKPGLIPVLGRNRFWFRFRFCWGENLRYHNVCRSAGLAGAALAGMLLATATALGGSASIAGATASMAMSAGPLFLPEASQAPSSGTGTPPGTGTSPGTGTTSGTGTTPPESANEIPVYLPGGDEAGPTLPSQRGIGAVRSGEGLFRIAPYFGASGIYDTGLAQLTLAPDGSFPSQSAAGVDLSFGITGSRAFRRSLLNIMYRGGYSHYPKVPFLSNSNHQGVIGVNHSFSRRLQLRSQNAFGIMNNAFFGNLGFQGGGLSGVGVPTNELFNTPVYFAQTNQTLTYQKTARLSFAGGGGGSAHWRQSGALAGVKSGNAMGNTSFRLTRRQTIGATYMFNQFSFTNQYGGSNVHNVSIEYSSKLSPSTEALFSIGGSRVESQSLQTVQVDPLIAALFGTSGGIEAVYRLTYLPTFYGEIRYGRRRWSGGVSASRTVDPGNGIVLTNRSTAFGAHLRYSTRRWNAGGSFNYNEMKGLKLEGINFSGVGGNVGIGITLGKGLSWVNDVAVRRFGGGDSIISNSFLTREQYRVSTGFYWSPSEFPLPLF